MTKKIIVGVVQKSTKNGSEWRGARVEDGQFTDAFFEKGLYTLVSMALTPLILLSDAPAETQVTVEVTIHEPEAKSGSTAA